MRIPCLIEFREESFPTRDQRSRIPLGEYHVAFCRFDFARNPEEVRAEAEQRRQSKMAARGGHRGPPPSRDVVGKARGQGQDSSVLRNRANKNQNKGKHHRQQADKKMSRGMF